jgi:UDP-N-acetylglucosamine 2-epimerase (non-hydrolysing)
MIDTLFHNIEKTKDVEDILQFHEINLPSDELRYGIVTLHRPSNVDNHDILQLLLETLNQVSETIPLIFPVHPRTAKKIKEARLEKLIKEKQIITTVPLGYLELLGLMNKAKLVFTDSGGIQEETTALNIPCITLRENTERPITIFKGTNTLVGTHPDKIIEASNKALNGNNISGKSPKYWDGYAAERIVDIIKNWL